MVGVVYMPFNGLGASAVDGTQFWLLWLKANTMESMGPELAGQTKYSAGGVLAPSGCAYFAPSSAGQGSESTEMGEHLLKASVFVPYPEVRRGDGPDDCQ